MLSLLDLFKLLSLRQGIMLFDSNGNSINSGISSKGTLTLKGK